MPKQNFKSHEKRKRELAKLGKRQAKDQKRAERRAEGEPVALSPAPGAVPALRAGAAAAPPKPLTFAEAVERWKNTKIAQPKRR